MTTRPTPLLPALLLLLLAACSSVGAPRPDVAAAPPAAPPAEPPDVSPDVSPAPEVSPLGGEATDLLARVQALRLASDSNRIAVHFAPEHRERALRDRALVEEAMAFYADSLAVRAPLTLAVLTREQWERAITWQPYGIPGVAGEPPVAFLPATDDNLAADDALALRAGMSAAARQMIEAHGRTFEEGARRYVGLVGLHELGHTYTQAFGIRPSHLWLNELLATYMAHAFLAQRHPELAMLWRGILRGYTDAVTPDHRSLEAFERLYFGVGARNYIWYQARFQEMVERAYAARGLDFLRAVRDAFPASERTPVSLEEAVRRLERIQPGFAPWAAGLQGGG